MDAVSGIQTPIRRAIDELDEALQLPVGDPQQIAEGKLTEDQKKLEVEKAARRVHDIIQPRIEAGENVDEVDSDRLKTLQAAHAFLHLPGKVNNVQAFIDHYRDSNYASKDYIQQGQFTGADLQKRVNELFAAYKGEKLDTMKRGAAVVYTDAQNRKAYVSGESILTRAARTEEHEATLQTYKDLLVSRSRTGKLSKTDKAAIAELEKAMAENRALTRDAFVENPAILDMTALVLGQPLSEQMQLAVGHQAEVLNKGPQQRASKQYQRFRSNIAAMDMAGNEAAGKVMQKIVDGTGDITKDELVAAYREQMVHNYRTSKPKLIAAAEKMFNDDVVDELALMSPEVAELARLQNEAGRNLLNKMKAGEKLNMERDIRPVLNAMDKGVLDQLPTDRIQNPQAKSAVEDYNAAVRDFNAVRDRGDSELASIINSGLPIEVILFMFLCLFTEREHEKLKLKMKEVALAEQLEKTGGVDMKDLKLKSSQILLQELQAEQVKYKTILDGFNAALRSVQDQSAAIVRNIR